MGNVYSNKTNKLYIEDKSNVNKVGKKILCSKISKQWLKLMEQEMNIKIMYSDDEGYGEFSIIGPNKRKIYFDGYCKEENYVFEFHGCRWHNCRKCYPYSDINVYNKTIKREQYIIQQGYFLIRIWEHEFKDYLRGKSDCLGNLVEIIQ